MAIFDLQFQQTDSQKVVIMAMTVVVVAAIVERYSGVKETATLPDIFVGAFIGTLILLLLSYILPEFAVGLAVIAAVTMIVAKGAPFWDAINAIFKHPKSATPQSPNMKFYTPVNSTGTFTSTPSPPGNG